MCHTLLIATSILAFSAVPALAAQDAPAPAPGQSATPVAPAASAAATSAVTDAQLEAFATAMVKVREISAGMQNGTPTTEQQAGMAAAIEASGLGITQFNAISTQVSADPVIVQWWDLPQRQDCWYHGGLDALHAQAPAGLPLFLGHSAPTARSLLHDVAHDAAWLISDGRNLTDAFDRVDQALAAKLRPDEPYIIIGHSGGAILTYKFLQQRLFAGSPATRPGRFLGAITIGSPVNTFLSSDLMRDSLPEGFLAPAPEAGSQRPFWINICHHNDIIATSLNPALTTGTERRICCRDVVIRRTLLERIPVIKEFTYWKSHLWAAHGWYFAKPGAFSDVVEDAIAALPATAINGGVAP